jgi:hypothetical protein
MFVRQLIRRWPTAFGCLCFNTFAVLATSLVYALSTDANGAMFWLGPIALDWPSSLMIGVSDTATTLQLALALLFLGGLQWTVLGMIFDLFLRRRVGAMLRNLWNTNER